MKKITFIIAALFATNFYAQNNLITKGDFEESPSPTLGITHVADGWYYRSAGSKSPIAFASDTDFFYGTKSGKMDESVTTSGRYGLPTLTTGSIYEISFDVKATGIETQDNNSKKLQVYYRRGTNTIINTIVTGYAPDTWTNWSGQIKYAYELANGDDPLDPTSGSLLWANPGDYQDMYIEFILNSVAEYDVYIDNVEVTLVADEATLRSEKLTHYGFSYAPNPVQDKMQLSATAEINSIQLFNAVGQEVLNQNINSTDASVDISNLPKGVYILKATINNTAGTYKVIKK